MREFPDWMVAYSDLPGRYYVVQFKYPPWCYSFNHVRTAHGCELQSHSLHCLSDDVFANHLDADQLADEAYAVFKESVRWFEPLPICKTPDHSLPLQRWLFGTSPELCGDDRRLLALRVKELPLGLATLTFDQDGFFIDADASNVEVAIEAHEAFEVWTGGNDREPSRQRFLP